MGLLDELMIKLTGDHSGLKASIAASTQLVEKFGHAAGEKMGSSIAAGVMKAEIALKALEFAFEKIKELTIDLVKEQMEHIDQLAKLSDRLGMTTEALAGLQYQAAMAGVDSAQLTLGLQKMEMSLSEAQEKGTGAADALHVLGLKISDLAGKHPDVQMGILADRINGINDASERTAVSMELFGKNGGRLFSVIKGGSEGMEKGAEEAKKLGLAVSRLDAAKVEAANEAFIKMHAVIEGIGNKLAIASAPFLEAIVNKLNEAAVNSDGFKDSIDSALNVAIDGASFLADYWDVLISAWYRSKEAIGLLSGTIWRTIRDFSEAIDVGIAVFKHWSDIAIAIGDNISATFKILWAALKAGFGEFAKYINDKFADIVDSLAKAVSYVSEDMASKLKSMGDGMRANGATFRDEMKADMNTAVAQAADAGARMNKTLGDLKPPPNPYLDNMVANADQFAADAKIKIDNRLNQPWMSDGVKEWGRGVVAEADRVAAEVAKKVQGSLDSSGKPGSDAGAMARAKKRDDNLKDLKDLQEKLETETALEMDEYHKKQKMIQELEDSGDLTKDERRKLELDLDADHNQKLLAARERAMKSGEKFSKQSWGVQTGAIVGFLNQQLQSVDATSKTMFEIQKAGAIAAAVMNTAEGATKAYAQFGAFGFAAAAAVIAAGAIQIGAIASTSFGGGKGSGGAGAGAIGPAPSVATGGNEPFGQTSSQPTVNRNVTINVGDGPYSANEVRKIISAINEQAGDGFKVKAG